MRQAHARAERHEGEQVSSEALYPALRAVPEVDDDLFEFRPAGRDQPRRPTGAAADYARATPGAPRRTVRIGGHGAQTALRPTPSEMRGPRPDRIAAWAFGFAIFTAVLAAFVGG